VQFEPEFVAGVRELFEQRIPFNALLGLKIEDIGGERVHGRIDMRPELVGHFVHNRIHGGVISACLDAMGGLAVMAAIGARHLDEPPFQRLHRFGKLGTIDLRIDYLRPGIGEPSARGRGPAPGLARGVDADELSRCPGQAAGQRGGGVHRVLKAAARHA
jgi:Uncharacterized protein, possibly involved in aromatic compounds catabolism